MKISVALPNYNHGEYIGKAIEGILNQTYTDFEILVCDDGSTDGSKGVILDYKRQDSRVKLIDLHHHYGYEYAFESCYRCASGDFFTGCAADDYLVDKKWFERANYELSGNPSIGGIYGKAKLLKNDTDEEVITLGSGCNDGWIKPENFRKGFLERKCFATGYSAIWQMYAIFASGGYPQELGPQSDYFINHYIPCWMTSIFVPEVTTHVRLFDNKSNYSMAPTIEDKIRRHGFFEYMMKPIFNYMDKTLVDSWRHQLIYDLCGGQEFEKYERQYYFAMQLKGYLEKNKIGKIDQL